MPDGVLLLKPVDVYGDPLREPVDIFLRHQALSHDPALRGIKPAKTIKITQLLRRSAKLTPPYSPKLTQPF
jgi:hypothetical protein